MPCIRGARPAMFAHMHDCHAQAQDHVMSRLVPNTTLGLSCRYYCNLVVICFSASSMILRLLRVVWVAMESITENLGLEPQLQTRPLNNIVTIESTRRRGPISHPPSQCHCCHHRYFLHPSPKLHASQPAHPHLSAEAVRAASLYVRSCIGHRGVIP